MKCGSTSLAWTPYGKGEHIFSLHKRPVCDNYVIVFSLCHNRWGKVSAYETGFAHQHSYKKLYMILDNGTLTFTADPHEVSGPIDSI